MQDKISSIHTDVMTLFNDWKENGKFSNPKLESMYHQFLEKKWFVIVQSSSALIAPLKTALSFTPKVSHYALLVVAKGMMLINQKYY